MHTHIYEENEHPEKESETKNFYFNVMNLSAKFEREWEIPEIQSRLFILL